MEFETSKDFLFVILALCILWFTVFLCWLLYQAGRVLKNANQIIESVTSKLELINDAVQYMKGKMDHVSKNMGAVSGLMSTVVEKFVINKLSSKLEARMTERPKKKTSKR